MDRFGMLKLFIAVSLLLGVCHSWTATVERPVKAVQGSCVLVPCSTRSFDKVAWYKYVSRGYPTVYSNDYSDIMDEFRGRTSVPGSHYWGDCSLKIDNVRYSDRHVGLYVWVWGSDGYNYGFYENHQIVHIEVLDASSPKMSVSNNLVQEGHTFTATCTLRHSCRSSPPTIYWQGLSAMSHSLTHTKNWEGIWETMDTATFNATQDANLNCYSGSYYSSTSVFINVTYAPKNVRIESIGSSDVDEGGQMSLQCTSKSNPAVKTYEWVVTQNTNTNRYTGNPFVLQNVRRGMTVSCIATNSIGQGQSGQLPLGVNYAPMDVKVEYTGNSYVVEGGQISLTCASTSKPAPTHYDWFVSPNSTTFSPGGSTVILRNVTRDTSVSCITSNSMGQGESQQLSLEVHYSPSILPGSFCVTRNEKLTCECQAKSKPNAVISWTVDGSSALFPDFNSTTEYNGSLTVSELTGFQGHNVTCTATNSVGQEFTQILVDVEGEASALVLIVGAAAAGAAGLCIIIAAVTAVVICKKRRHAEPSEDLTIAQPRSHERKRHSYRVDSDEDLYANTPDAQWAYKEEAEDSCIYANYEPF